jgi:hypothetical protein
LASSVTARGEKKTLPDHAIHDIPAAISSAADNSTLAQRAIVGILDHRNRPTVTKPDEEISAIP